MQLRPKDSASFHRPAFLPGVELISATYGPRSFPMHAHPEYVIGAIVQGCELLAFADARFLLPVGSTLFIRPDEVHANEGVGDEPFGYRVIYAEPEMFQATLHGVQADARCDLSVFADRVSRSTRLYEHVLRSHRALMKAEDALEQYRRRDRGVPALAGAATGKSLRPANAATSRRFGARRALIATVS